MIPISARPYGEDGQAWLLAGNGSPTNPYVNVPYSRVFNSGQFGNVQCGTACAYNNYTFNEAGVLSPMVHGTPTGTANLESGGDGSYVKIRHISFRDRDEGLVRPLQLRSQRRRQLLCPGDLGAGRQHVELDQLGGQPVRQPPEHPLRQQSVPGGGDATATGGEHRLRYSGCDGLALPARRAFGVSADRHHAPGAAHHAVFLGSILYLEQGRRRGRAAIRTACTGPRRTSRTSMSKLDSPVPSEDCGGTSSTATAKASSGSSTRTTPITPNISPRWTR